MEYSVNKVEIKILIISEYFKSNNCYEIIRTVVPELDKCIAGGSELNCAKVPSLKRIVIMNDKIYR